MSDFQVQNEKIAIFRNFSQLRFRNFSQSQFNFESWIAISQLTQSEFEKEFAISQLTQFDFRSILQPCTILCLRPSPVRSPGPILRSDGTRVLIVRPSEAQARKPYDLYLSRIVMEFQNSFFKYKLWGFSSFSIFRE